MRDLSTVCFDLDDTLCVSEQSAERVLGGAFTDAGVDPFCSVGDLEAVEPRDLPTSQTDVEYYANLLQAAAEEAGTRPSQVAEVATAFDDRVDRTAVSFRNGAKEALDFAKDHYHVGLVTNGAADTQRRKLEALGIADAFDAMVFCDPGNGIDPKPDPTALTLVLDELDAAPAETVVVGDGLGTDVAAADAIGSHSIWVPTTEPVDDPEPTPTHTLDSVAAVPDVFPR